METKLFEVRDRGTCIPVLAVALDAWAHPPSSREHLLLRRAGYGDRCILLGAAEGGPFAFDPWQHNDARTRCVAHRYIAEHWDALTSGEVVDVRFILGETTEPAATDLP
jgi:hypothetical protein